MSLKGLCAYLGEARRMRPREVGLSLEVRRMRPRNEGFSLGEPRSKSGLLRAIFANVSHQTRLDTRSKARRPIKVGIMGWGRSGTS